ncbi:hypothetical protein BGZ75_001475 [Mortierella antarctica]|nr:hypothetical protein BGZ67_008323 [Mortierella alpina]KAF9986759.1 hypothetical protein BGZ75_001475 [Mortierella antarctica]
MASLYLSSAIRVLAPTLLADYAIQLFGFTVSTLLQTEKFYDLAGSTSFIVCTYLSLFQPWDKASSRHRAIHPRQMIASCTTVLWALYLGSFLFKRALKNGDKRFDKVKKSPAQFLVYWLVQGVWVAMTALPV